MYRDLRVAAILPCYNEEKLVAKTITTLPDFVDHNPLDHRRLRKSIAVRSATRVEVFADAVAEEVEAQN